MESAASRSPWTPMAFAYAVTTAIALAVLPHLEAPLERFGASHAGVVVLGSDPIRGALWGLGLGAILAAAGQAITRWTEWGKRFHALVVRLMGGIHPIDALLLAGLSASAEELVFRGILLPYIGLWGSAVAFGLAHLLPREGLWPWAMWTAIAGLGLGWVALRTGGLLAPILAHFIVNAIGLLLIAKRSK